MSDSEYVSTEDPTKTRDGDVRRKLKQFFLSKTFDIILAILITIDLAIVLTDIILLLIYCDEIPEDTEEAMHILGYISISLLGIFIIELCTQMYAFGLREWWSHPLHVVDIVITTLTFIMEIIFHENEEIENIVGLLIIFRLWRLVRVIHVTVEAADLKQEVDEEELLSKIEKLEKENEELKKENDDYKEQLNKLKGNGI